MTPPPAFTATLESVLESVELAEEKVRLFAAQAGFSDNDQFFLGLAVREIVINAILHGNKLDPAKKVGFSLAMQDGALVIDITDEGSGFRLESVPDPGLPQNQNRTSGRGITMALAIADEFTVTTNAPSGTHIRMRKHLPPTDAVAPKHP